MESSRRNKWALFVISGIISVYAGYNGVDGSITDGKNIINFFFLYSLGSLLRDSEETWSRWKAGWIAAAFLALNFLLVWSHVHFNGTWFSRALWQLSYPYNSPVVVINAVLAFFLFGKMKFRSRAVNWVAGSTFATYLIHRNQVVQERILKPVVLNIDAGPWSNAAEIGWLLLLSAGIFIVCILIDKVLGLVLSPLQKKIVAGLERSHSRFPAYAPDGSSRN